MNWIRIDVGIPDDERIDELANALGRDTATAVGLVVCVLVKLPKHARDGNIGKISPLMLEKWAGWRGKRGRFSEAFRELFCTSEGVVRTWEKHNGSAIRENDADRLRQQEKRAQFRKAKQEREDREHAAKLAGSSGGSSGEPSTGPSTATRRTGRTGRDEVLKQQQPLSTARAKPGPVDPLDSVTGYPEIAAKLSPHGREALAAFCRSARVPVGVVAIVAALHDRDGYDWPTIDRAVLELAAQNTPATAKGLQVYCHAIKHADKPAPKARSNGADKITAGRETLAKWAAQPEPAEAVNG